MSQYWVPKRDLEQHQATFSPATKSRRCLHAASCCLWLVGKNTPWHLYMTALLQKRTEQRIRPSARECILPLGAIACLPFRNAFLLHARLRYPLAIQHTVAMITACLQTYIYIYITIWFIKIGIQFCDFPVRKLLDYQGIINKFSRSNAALAERKTGHLGLNVGIPSLQMQGSYNRKGTCNMPSKHIKTVYIDIVGIGSSWFIYARLWS